MTGCRSATRDDESHDPDNKNSLHGQE
jgi:hypothetical protein